MDKQSERIRVALSELLEAIGEGEMFRELEAGCDGQGPVVGAYQALDVDLPNEITEWLGSDGDEHE